MLTYRYKLKNIPTHVDDKVYYRQSGFFRFDTDNIMLGTILHKSGSLIQIEQLSPKCEAQYEHSLGTASQYWRLVCPEARRILALAFRI